MTTVPTVGQARLLFGGDYNPEQWSEDVWRDDIRLMRKAGVNTATLGVFAWSSIEPEEGRYEFGWLDRVFQMLADNGIAIILATPTASPPPWFSRAHPEALPITKDGIRLVHGSRDTYNPAAPAYREAAARIAHALAERYGRHPALCAWHLHNEYGTMSYGPLVDVEFRTWLRQRYGALEDLNRAWHTAFWSQGYGTWDEILAPQQTQYLPNPTQVLDFRRFTADMLRACYREQITIVRKLSPGIPVTTNFILPDWLHYDHWGFADDSDFVSIDHYLDSSGVEGAAHAAFGGDLARSFGHGAPWLLMEQSANTTSRAGRILANEPGQLMRTSMQHVARGAFGVLFFQWRAPYAGAEFFHSTMVPHVGEESRVFREVTELGEMLDRVAELAAPPDGAVNMPRVAIAWEPDAWWAAETSGLPSDAFSLLRSARRVHRALWHLGVNCDFVRLDHDLVGYSLVLVPNQLLVKEAQPESLSRFVYDGGHTLVFYFSGTFNDDLHIVPGSYSGAFAELLGLRVEELLPLEPGASVKLDDGTTATEWAERIELGTAKAHVRYQTGQAAGCPAITRNDVGTGSAWYVSTELDDDGLKGVLRTVLERAAVVPDAPGAGEGLEAIQRFAGDRSYLVLINHDWREHETTASGTDILSGRKYEGSIVLAGGETLVLRTSGTVAVRPVAELTD